MGITKKQRRSEFNKNIQSEQTLTWRWRETNPRKCENVGVWISKTLRLRSIFSLTSTWSWCGREGEGQGLVDHRFFFFFASRRPVNWVWRIEYLPGQDQKPTRIERERERIGQERERPTKVSSLGFGLILRLKLAKFDYSRRVTLSTLAIIM